MEAFETSFDENLGLSNMKHLSILALLTAPTVYGSVTRKYSLFAPTVDLAEAVAECSELRVMFANQGF